MRIESNTLRTCILAAVLSAAGCGGSGGGAIVSPPGQPILATSGQSVDFGDVAVGATTVLEVTFSNEGTAPLSLQQNSVSGPAFATSGIGQGVTLAPGQHVSLNVNFNPSVAGSANGIVSLSSNASSQPVNVPLSGVGISTPHSVALNWVGSKSAVVGYNVYSSSDLGVSWTRLNSSPAPATSYTDWDVQSGTSYLFAVTSIDASNRESPFSYQVIAPVPVQ